ncbi:hypothetical protein BO98_01455 [Candidatus Synechococcus spongiarum LMB bulk10D]|nr:hypothetical protein BO98_01455 [Candidatus Synechococcus spongiarum LMB bulk10D]
MGLLAQAPNLDQDSDPDKRLILSQTELTLLEGEEETFFKLRLSSRLKESEVVNVTISSNNEENIAITPSSLIFTKDNWQEWKDIKVSLKNNEIDEDSLSVVIYLSPSGSGYDENNAQDLYLTMNKPAKKLNISLEANVKELKVSSDNTENLIEHDIKFLIRDDMKLNITEGKSFVFHVGLSNEPTSPVQVKVVLTDEQKRIINIDDNDDFTITPSVLDFTKKDQQTITFSSNNDSVHEADQTISICFDPVGDGYNELVVLDLEIIDDDTPGLALNSSELTLTEGESAFLPVRLRTQPTAPVTVKVSTDNPEEVFVKPTTLTFSNEDTDSRNWEYLQYIEIFSNENQYNENDRQITIFLDPSEGGYDNSQSRKFYVTIKDKNKLPLFTLSIATVVLGGNILVWKFGIRASINDIDIKFQNKENDLLSRIDEKVTQIQTEMEEIKDKLEKK